MAYKKERKLGMKDWDENEINLTIISQFYLLKLHEQTMESSKQSKRLISNFENNMASTNEDIESARFQYKKFQKMLEKVENSLKNSGITQDDQTKWKQSMTCPTCFHSFLNRDHLLDHLRNYHIFKSRSFKEWKNNE